MRDRSGRFWSSADIAGAAERASTHLNRQVLPVFDSSDLRDGARSR
jgi:hypothetical protein